MEPSRSALRSKRRLPAAGGLAAVMLGVAALYFAKPVLMPLTVAVLLTFLLNPVVNALHRWGFRRSLSVFVVGITVFSLLGAITYALGRQVTMLAAELPQYKDNVIRKVTDFRNAGRSKVLERLERTFREIVGEIQRQDVGLDEKKPVQVGQGSPRRGEDKPVAVVVQGEGAVQFLPLAVGSVMQWMVTAAMVIALVMFMLLRLHELRNRMIRLVGYGRLSATTKALDDAGARISRYLLMQSIINTTYGVSAGIGLYFIGIPYVVLLGFIAGTMRFIPYLGPPLGALLPLALSMAVFDNWASTLLVLALFVCLETVVGMVLEPLLYGQSAGVSEVALLVAITFWTWIWGPVGLALATPLTVCLVVLCKHIPELEFVEILLSDEPIVDAPLIYYQRLLARDTDEAAQTMGQFLKSNSSDQIYDRLLIPALRWARRDALRGKLDPEDQRFIVHATQELVETLAPRAAVRPADSADAGQTGRAAPRIRVLGCPAQDAGDEAALAMLGRVLDPDLFQMEVLSSNVELADLLAEVRERAPDLVCVGTLTPNPIAPARHLCRRLRDAFPRIKLLALRWSLGEEREGEPERVQLAGADFTGASLLEIRGKILELFPPLASPEEPAGADVVGPEVGRYVGESDPSSAPAEIGEWTPRAHVDRPGGPSTHAR